MFYKMYLNLFIVVVLFNVCHNWVINDMHSRAFNETGYLLDDSVDLSEFSEEDLARLRFSLIFPGTKWCGPGDIADDYDDLGVAENEDKCCREHDHCSDIILPGEQKYNITNDAYYTRLSCNCDETFRQCLLDANSSTSKTIGIMYFNIIGTKCFRKDYPVTGCVKKGGWLQTKCIEYSYDTSREPIYQWFDVPQYCD